MLSFLLLYSLTGYYIYIETSSPREEDDIAMLRFQGKSDKPSVCLSFYFHMYGNDVGEIYLYNRGRTVWRMAGNQGDVWRRAEIKITGDYDVRDHWKYNAIQYSKLNISVIYVKVQM